MFGLGKLVSGLAGGLLDKIGLGFLSPLVSMAVNFFSGNYLALIGDVTNLVSQFSDSSFLKNLSKLQPLGDFARGGCFGSMLSLDNLDALRGTAQLLGLDKADRMLSVVEDFSSSFNLIQQNREASYYGRLF